MRQDKRGCISHHPFVSIILVVVTDLSANDVEDFGAVCILVGSQPCHHVETLT